MHDSGSIAYPGLIQSRRSENVVGSLGWWLGISNNIFVLHILFCVVQRHTNRDAHLFNMLPVGGVTFDVCVRARLEVISNSEYGIYYQRK